MPPLDFNDVLDAVHEVQDAVGSVQDALGISGDGSLLGDWLKSVGEALGNAIVAIWNAFVEAVKNTAESTAEAFRSIFTKLMDLLVSVWKRLVEALSGMGQKFEDLSNNLTNFLHAFQCGPLGAIQVALDLSAFLKEPSIDLHVNLTARVNAVLQSFEGFLEAIGGAGGLFVIQAGMDGFKSLFQGVLSGEGSAQAQLTAILQGMFAPGAIILKAIEAAFKGKWWASIELPCGMTGGKLNKWINGDTYQGLSTEEVVLARQFRCRLVAAVDSFFRARVATDKLGARLAISDTKLSAESLSELVCVLLDTTIGFMFEPDCFPVLEVDLDAFEDVGLGFSATFARQIRFAIRGAIGLFLRGIWGYTVGNHTLIEFFGAVLSIAFTAIAEGVVKNLTWSLQIQTRYKGDPYGGPSGVLTWDSLDRSEPGEGNGSPLSIEYVAYVRGGDLAASVRFPDSLKDVLKDYGAYLDACYQQFHVESRFPKIAADAVTISRADIQDNVLTVWATTSAFAELPRPVIRAYFCCHMLILHPGANPHDPYTLVFPITRPLRRRCTVTVLSNRGGSVTRTISIN